MNKKTIEKKLEKAGFTGFFLNKNDGIWYLLGDENVINHHIERCLHVIRLDDYALKAALDKAKELTSNPYV